MMIVGCVDNSRVISNQEEVIETPEPYRPTYSKEFLMGKFDPMGHESFVEIDAVYADRKGRWMIKPAYEAFIEMWTAAKAAGIDLKIISAARNFDYQKGIWERKWSGATLLDGKIDATTIEDAAERASSILRYSAMPGASRHHWGTDIDINDLNNSYFDSGQGKKEFEWLEEHAYRFGFGRPYTDKKNGRSGYEEEKWHWSYLPLSKVMTKDAELLIRDKDLAGFGGSDVASDLKIKKNYILGLDPSCTN
jgi:LAS superfamily LD-carboxypeptidase LdcB